MKHRKNVVNVVNTAKTNMQAGFTCVPFYNLFRTIRAYCKLAYEQSQQQDENLRNNVRNRQKCEKYTKTKNKEAKNTKVRSRP